MRHVILSGDTGQLEDLQSWQRLGVQEYTAPLIDLHARRSLEYGRSMRQTRGYLACIAMLLLGLTVLIIPLTAKIQDMNGRLKLAHVDTSQWQQRYQNLSRLDAALELDRRDNMRYEDSRDRRLAYHSLCTLLAARLPASVYMEQIQIDAKQEPEKILLIGDAESTGALQKYLWSLSDVTFFTNLRLEEMTPFTKLGPDALHFRIEARGNRALNMPRE